MKDEKKYKNIGLLVGIGILLAIGYGVQQIERPLVDKCIQEEQIAQVSKEVQVQEITTQDTVEVSLPSPEVTREVPVYICGEVVKPGVYYMKEGAILAELMTMCGGLTEEAEPYYLNLASPVIPHEKIVVPKVGEEIDKFANSYDNREEYLGNKQEVSSKEGQKININSASEAQLQELPGIGKVKAAAIVAYREEKGGFKDINELLQISGIGEKTLEKIRDLVTR
ncbi:hypothetical protein CS063_05490 [Sporanaerobium hydrogeniformans]|uniref:Uncharacterized protein n=1 Tax=Sporanaerobium hydrogeniformans TaxID=3072179 RepID=A0AC61DF29_9FIRM|nr:helix-hairpin-helix domain-containing protein [Sporanaerobium hydrogeniformans]PHV71500.1 hypothetical protein CS063_05490 [Sporanaerobium hydrogeniformans]